VAERLPYAFDRPVPFLLERGVEQVVSCGWRYGDGGALVTPDAGTTVAVYDTTTTALTASSVSISGDRAEITLTPSAALPLGAGYEVRTVPAFSSVTYPEVRARAYLCDYVPQAVVSPADLVGGDGIPELAYRVPYSQGANGSGVGWQPQCTAAYYALIRKLMDREEPIWQIVSLTDYYEWCLTRAMLLAIQTFRHGDTDGAWNETARMVQSRHRAAEAELRVGYSDDHRRRRRGADRGYQMAPVGRPWW
jgi:hypothetical protein